MAFASTVLMLAGSPQTFLGAASVQDSLFLFVDVVSVYGRQFGNEFGRTLARFSRPLINPSNKRRKVRQHIAVLGLGPRLVVQGLASMIPSVRASSVELRG